MGEQNEGLAGTGITVMELVDVLPEIAKEAFAEYNDDKKLDTEEIVGLLEFAATKLAEKADPETQADIARLAGILGLIKQFV